MKIPEPPDPALYYERAIIWCIIPMLILGGGVVLFGLAPNDDPTTGWLLLLTGIVLGVLVYLEKRRVRRGRY